jgi:hypothetical protein
MHSLIESRRHVRRVRVRKLLAVTAVMLLIAAFGHSSSAMATPKGIFSIFSDCPVTTPGVSICQYAQTSSGEFSIGSTKVPINKTITLQGGGIPTGNPANENEYFLIPATDGNSLSKTDLNVPGGLAGLINCEEIKGTGLFEIIERGTCKAIFENKATGVTATTELVANRHNPAILDLFSLVVEEGTALTLPVRVHLKNQLLGNSCYIGSEASPVQLHLTTGATHPNPPNTSIRGKTGTIESLEEKEQIVTRLKENTLVDNGFSAPVAEGCGEFFSFIIDPIVNAKLGLPSAGGHNTAILAGTLNATSASAVIASEKF